MIHMSLLIPGLSTTVVGTGRPVHVEVFLPRVGHSVADAALMVAIQAVKTGESAAWVMLTECRTPANANNSGEGVYFKRRLILEDESEWTFSAAMCGTEAGTSSLYASGGAYPNPASISAISR